eukprot:scaffold321083_cov45-Prasinocladus_malaysianus.AAC.1
MTTTRTGLKARCETDAGGRVGLEKSRNFTGSAVTHFGVAAGFEKGADGIALSGIQASEVA